MDNDKQIKTIDNRIVLIQYICAVIVLLIHSNNTVSWDLSGEQQTLALNIEMFLTPVWHVAVPTFFFISGYFFFLNFTPEKYPSVIKRRFFSLAIPFLIWQTFSFLLYFIVGKIPIFSSKMRLKPTETNLHSILESLNNSNLWYIKELFFYALLSIVIYYIIKNRYIAIAFIIAIIVINSIIPKYFEPLYWLPMFLTGAFAGMHIKKYEFSAPNKTLKIVISVCILFVLLALYILLEHQIFEYVFRIVSGVLFPVVLTSLLKKDIHLSWCFTISFFIYCSHGFLLQAVGKIYLLVLGVSNFSALLCYFTAPIVSIIIITIIAYLIKRLMPSVWSLLNGGRKR